MIFCVCISCKNESKTLRDQVTTPTTAATPTSVNGIVHHYICPKGCSGGDAAGTCSECGSAFAHNQAFHNQAFHNQPTKSANTNEGLSPIIQKPAGTTNNTTTSSTEEPAQNAAGVWHYTCSNGCSGGAGSALACAQCGSTLAHNQAYHN